MIRSIKTIENRSYLLVAITKDINRQVGRILVEATELIREIKDLKVIKILLIMTKEIVENYTSQEVVGKK